MTNFGRCVFMEDSSRQSFRQKFFLPTLRLAFNAVTRKSFQNLTSKLKQPIRCEIIESAYPMNAVKRENRGLTEGEY